MALTVIYHDPKCGVRLAFRRALLEDIGIVARDQDLLGDWVTLGDSTCGALWNTSRNADISVWCLRSPSCTSRPLDPRWVEAQCDFQDRHPTWRAYFTCNNLRTNHELARVILSGERAADVRGAGVSVCPSAYRARTFTVEADGPGERVIWQ